MKAHSIIIAAAALITFSAAQAMTAAGPTKEPIPGAQASQALAPEALAKKIGCFECHSVDKDMVGPAYRNVAERYKDDPKARVALIETVKKGGKGHWTQISKEVPMPPFSARLSAADITRLVDWVLSSKDSVPK